MRKAFWTALLASTLVIPWPHSALWHYPLDFLIVVVGLYEVTRTAKD